MRSKILTALVILGIVGGLVSAYVYGIRKQPLPPAFNPAQNPYAKGIYANGIIESYQSHGANINIYPEVSGTVTQILVKEGDKVTAGTPLLLIDDSIQKATV
ncbi:MAG: biotin/lipoyl-binding protein, partial [Desulfobaccales bacterium]